MNLKKLAAGLDFGETFYLVDSDFRTAQAQGWSQSDKTGPLDLFHERNPGRVFYTSGGPSGSSASDAAALQAANDALVDFRGDMIYFTPGNYAPATAIVVDVPDARWIGSRRARGQAATLTAGVAACLGPTAAADRWEIAYLRLVPLTAAIMIARATAGADDLWMHHFTYDARGITASTATILIKDTAACLNTMLEDFLYLSNTAIGPLYQAAAASITGCIQNWLHIHTANTLVTSMFETITGGAGCTGWTIGPGHAQLGGGGLITQYGAMIDMTSAATNATIRNCTSSVGANVAATGWEAGTGVAAEGDIVNSWIATIGGGAGRAALIGGA